MTVTSTVVNCDGCGQPIPLDYGYLMGSKVTIVSHQTTTSAVHHGTTYQDWCPDCRESVLALLRLRKGARDD